MNKVAIVQAIKDNYNKLIASKASPLLKSLVTLSPKKYILYHPSIRSRGAYILYHPSIRSRGGIYIISSVNQVPGGHIYYIIRQSGPGGAYILYHPLIRSRGGIYIISSVNQVPGSIYITSSVNQVPGSMRNAQT